MHDVIDIEVTPLSSACGAAIKGVDLTKELSEPNVGIWTIGRARYERRLRNDATIARDPGCIGIGWRRSTR